MSPPFDPFEDWQQRRERDVVGHAAMERGKDELEVYFHGEVCAGRMPLEQAQRQIAEHWTAAYRRYFGEP